MAELSRIQNEISDLTNILSLITKRDPGFQEDNQPFVPESSSCEEHDIDLETRTELVDEAEFEAPIAPKDAEADAIKRRTLDRLAEVLARFKNNAKHVTGAIMVEEPKDKSVTFFCAKNEGLDAVDMDFLRKLEYLLQNMATNGKRNPFMDGHTERLDQVFNILFDHLGARVKYYSTILHDVIEKASQTAALPKILTSRNVQEGLQQAGTRDWEDNNGLCFSFRLDGAGEKFSSDKAVDCLSDQEEEALVQEASSEIQNIFGKTFHEVPQIPTKNLLKKVYYIVRHPRQRPALKTLLRRMLHDDERPFTKAWASLLYLTRIFYAAVTFVDLATRSGFVSIKFRQLPPVAARKPRNSDKGSLSKVLASLGGARLTQGWRDFFQTPKTVKEFVRQSRLKKSVHGEVQLILHIVNRTHAPEQITGKVFPYMGCSKKCCFFCELFRTQHGAFQARGTHQTLFPLWALPQTLPQSSLGLLRRFSELLRDILRGVLSMPYPPLRRDLLQQSSAALSTAQAVQMEAPTYSTRPQTLNKLVLGFGGVIATDHQVEFLPSVQTPGYATLMGGPGKQKTESMPIGEAEISKINHERRIYMLEEIHEMPSTRLLDPKLCRRCRSPARYWCSACWTSYCSRTCQKRHWTSHVFTCRVLDRPNDVDFLRFVTRRFTKILNNSGDEERIHNAMLYLLADDHICSTFGFNNCGDRLEVLNLVCLYSTILSRCKRFKALQELLETGHFGHFMEEFCEVERSVAQGSNKKECACVTWFLEFWPSEIFIVPNRDKTSYNIWEVAVASAIDCLGLTQMFKDGNRFKKSSQSDVIYLYVTIQPSLWLIPDIYSSSWLKFGFCHCKSFRQRAQLARQYLELAVSDATFDDIVYAYETSSLADLMRAHGIDIPEWEDRGIRLHRPPPCEYSVYRLMIGVEHALSGRFCDCFSVDEGRRCHAYFETSIDRESDTNFGFHLTSSGERWQLLNFYKYLFRLPGFDPRHMAEATEDSDLESLENYLDSLVPDMRRKISDRNRTNILFPRLKDRLRATTADGQSVSHVHLPCDCKVHDVVGPPGISHRGVSNAWYREHACQHGLGNTVVAA
ncbi:hypothetical protein F4779DRAFT_617415 [Xylariaceae sp. FL0662B]|nr:hypothetical protein F4779DRAFT_617415 [Xylariaceae sp. FL0662B]